MADWAFLLAAATFAAYVAAVCLGLRLLPGARPALLVVALGALVGMAALALLPFAGVGYNLWVFLAVYGVLVALFVMGFGATYKSLSLRILADLLRQPGRSDSYSRIFARYLVEESYENRLAIIRDHGLVRVDAGQYRLSPEGERLARRVQRIQRGFGITKSG